jgi:phosphatidate cytidylyltransferase
MSNLLKRTLSSIVLLFLFIFLILQGTFWIKIISIILFLLSSYELCSMSINYLIKIIAIFFLFFSFLTFYQLSNETIKIVFVVLICVSTDIGGYIFGKIFKGPKLTKISPNKTYAGMIGGFLLSILTLNIIFNLINFSTTLSQSLLITILISSISQLGDIIISYLKRMSKIKNTGDLIPGHGGLLDRIDGMIFAFPIYYLINYIVVII